MPHQKVEKANRRLGKIMRSRMTPTEFALWGKLRNRGLMGMRFRRQAPLGPYIVDFFCTEAKLAVEVDGGQHARHGAIAADETRDSWLNSHGVRVLRFTNDQVSSDITLVCDAIWGAAADRLGER